MPSIRSIGGRLPFVFLLLFLVACGGADPSGEANDAAPAPDAPHVDPFDSGHHADAGDANDGVDANHADAADAADANPADEDASDVSDANHVDAADAADAEVVDAADGGFDGDVDAADASDAQVVDAADASDASDAGDASDASDASDDADASDADTDANEGGPVGPIDTDHDGVPDTLDCAPGDGNLWQMLPGFADTDLDGVGAGPKLTVCSGKKLPDGYSTRDDDCAPSVKADYQLLSYTYRDADRDGYTVLAPAGSSVCTGASLPAGYTNVAGETDCDDGNKTKFMWVDGYADPDDDTYGSGKAERFCTDGSEPPHYAKRDGDCAAGDQQRWQMLPYAYRDNDDDKHTVASSGQICSGATLPKGYLATPLGDDCNDDDPSVFAPQMLFHDEDEDGFGSGSAEPLCVAVSPKKYATVGGDCAEGDKDRYVLLAYSYRDVDLDTYTRPETGKVCTGKTLPAGYLNAAKGLDCDDGNKNVYVNVMLYPDEDDDGVGVDPGAVQCLGDTDPPKFAEIGGDCAPNVHEKYYWANYSYVDRDGDGATAPESGRYCDKGELVAPYFTTAKGLDCDDGNKDKDHYGPVYADGDHDGFGAGRAVVACLGKAIPDGFSQYGTDGDDATSAVKEDLDDEIVEILY